MKHKGLNQLLCAAVVNNRFRETLLEDPAQAIAMGYLDHSFSLTPEERDLVIDIRAQRFEDFATQVHHWLSGNGNGNGHNGNSHNGNGHNGNGHNGNGHNGNGHNGNGHNGNGNGHSAVASGGPFVDLYRARVSARADRR